MDSFKKSLKPNGPFKHSRKISAGGAGSEINQEELPILLDHQPSDQHNRPKVRRPANDGEPSGHSEVILKVDDGGSSAVSRSQESAGYGGKVWRESRYDFWSNNDGIGTGGSASWASGARASDSGDRNEGFEFVRRGNGTDDPPTKLIGDFLHKQKVRGETTLDLDLEMEELRLDRTKTPMMDSPLSRASKDLKVSFQHDSTEISSNESVRRRYKEFREMQEESKRGQPSWHQSHHEHGGSSISGVQNDSVAEAMRSASNLSFQSTLSLHRKSHLLKAKGKSRLTDPPAEPDRLSGLVNKSGQLRSGFLGRTDDEEDDPFLEEDFPDDFRRGKLDALTVLQWISLFLITAALVCTLSIRHLRENSLWEFSIWKWEVMVLVLICGRLVSGWGIGIGVFFIERNFLLRKKVLYFVYGVKRPVQNCLWLGLVLIAWHLLFDKRVKNQTNSDILDYVRKSLVCLLLGTLIWLAKTLMLKVLASSFHVSTYFDRIQESLFNQYVIETLSGPPRIELQKSEEEQKKIADEVQRLQNAGVPVPPDLRAAALSSIKSGERVRSNVGSQRSLRGKDPKLSRVSTKNGSEGINIDHLHKLTSKNVSAWNMKRLLKIVRYGSITTLDEQIQGPSLDDESTTTEIKSEREAKAAAKKIFQNVARPGFNRFEGATETRRISKSALKNWVVNAFRERRALSLTLNDTKTAVERLGLVVNVIFSIFIVVLWIILLGIASRKVILYISSQIVLVAFIFGNTLKNIFEAIIFLFVMHPFDVGDRCEIDDIQMVVEEMNILTTVFLRHDNLKIIVPNSVLATKVIHNHYRSPDMGEFIEIYKLAMSIWLSHTMNHQDIRERWARRSVVVEEVLKICQEFDITPTLVPPP
ncbi:Mechanosensitive ion channel protein 8, partial [Cucurbita argyrosperma subsp. argyrosperma]